MIDSYKAVKKVGWASFFLNCSSLIVFSYFAVYLKKELKISFSQLGFLDGCVDFLSYVMRLCSGVMSDLLVNRRLFFFLGVLLVVLAKPLEAIFRTFTPMFFTKIMERFGNGLQATPRDALISDYSDSETEETRSKYFGTRQAMGAMGSLVGSILASVLFYYLQDFQLVFWVATPVGIISLLIILFGVKNKYKKVGGTTVINTQSGKSTNIKFKLSDLKEFNREFWIYIGATSIYFIAKVSDSMALLYSISSRDVAIYCTPLFFVVFHIGSMLSSYFMGLNKRRIGSQTNILKIGISIFITALILMLFLKSHLIAVLLGMAMLGSYSGIANGLLPAGVSKLAPQHLVGTAHGIYNVATAISLLIGGSFFGLMSDFYGQATALQCSLSIAICSLFVITILKSKKVIQ